MQRIVHASRKAGKLSAIIAILRTSPHTQVLVPNDSYKEKYPEDVRDRVMTHQELVNEFSAPIDVLTCPKCGKELEAQGNKKHHCKDCDIMVIESWYGCGK